MMDRRSFAGLLAMTLAGLAATRRSVLADLAQGGTGSPRDIYLAACKSPSSGFGLGIVAEAGADSGWTLDVETRLHGGAVRPGAPDLAVVARRQGRIALIIDARDGRVVTTLPAREDRFYLGHAAFDAAGERLFIAEAVTSSAAGLIGVYDARRGYARIGEWPTLGTDPHELLLSSDGGSLWVANGGVDLHPDTGRAILNEGGITSTLVQIDLAGRVVRQITLPTEFATLSLRHMALAGDDGVVVGCQDQGDVSAGLPLVWHAGRDGIVRPLNEDAGGWLALNGYIGSIATDVAGRTVLATSPRGNRAIALSLDDPRRWSEYFAFDVGGVAARAAPGAFLLTTGAGAAIDVAVAADGTLEAQRSVKAPVQWDNHIIIARRTAAG